MAIVTKYYCDCCNADISDNSAKWAQVSVNCKYNDKFYNTDLLLCTDCWFKLKDNVTSFMNKNQEQLMTDSGNL